MNKEVLPSMLDRNSGQIVAISSLGSLVGSHSLSAYVASKWGVTGEFWYSDVRIYSIIWYPNTVQSIIIVIIYL